MPKVLKEMPKAQRKGRSPKYDFNEFFTKSDPVELTQGTKEEVEKGKADYSCTTRTMRHNLFR
jgi:hypothetical protein